MTKFICKDCGYRFESESEQFQKRCPYCGKIGLIKEPTAEDLLRE